MATRDDFIIGLQELADYLIANPDVPTPQGTTMIQVHAIHGDDDARRACVDRVALAMGVEARDEYGDGTTWQATLHFGPIEFFAIAHTEESMRDFREADRLGAEALAAMKAATAEGGAR